MLYGMRKRRLMSVLSLYAMSVSSTAKECVENRLRERQKSEPRRIKGVTTYAIVIVLGLRYAFATGGVCGMGRVVAGDDETFFGARVCSIAGLVLAVSYA
jgi:hypothetical protein